MRRAVRSGAVWGVLFGFLVRNEALSFESSFPTAASRRQFAETFGENRGLAAVTGPARELGTLEGFVAWRMFGLMIVVASIWGLLTATRLLRGEEDSGRWELLLSGRTTRRHATAQALLGGAAGFVVLWALTAAFTASAVASESVGFSTSAALFYATAGTASAAMFLAIGALTSQLGRTRRQANGLAAGVFGVAYLVRMTADGVGGLAWLRWASPLGWVENTRPLTGSQPLALVPVALLTAVAAGAAVVLAARRDVGAGVLQRSESSRPNTRLLGSPVALVARLERWVALSWIAGLALLALVFGVVARSAAEGNIGDVTIEESLARFGAHAGGAAAWIGYELVYISALVAFAAGGQISAMRNQEADGLVDHLLTRPVSRGTWLLGHIGFGVLMVVVAGLATGIGAWVGLVGGDHDLSVTDMLAAGVNVAVPALLVLGLGTLLFGLAPRITMPILYALVLWWFVIEIIGSSITTNRWLLDTSVYSHLGPVPATSLEWVAVAWLTGLGLAAAAVGFATFSRRDLTGA